MSTKIKVTIGTFEREYVLVETDAPQRYDGFGTLEVYRGPAGLESNKGKAVRFILVGVKHLEWQEGRNRSGLHTWLVPEEDLSHWVEEKLIERLTGGDA